MHEFKSPGSAQRFVSMHAAVYNLFHLRRDRIPTAQHRSARTRALQIWAEVSGMAIGA